MRELLFRDEFEVCWNRLYICPKVRFSDMFELHKLIKMPSEALLQNQASSFLVKDLVFLWNAG